MRKALTEREKELLTALGRHPDIPLKDLLAYTSYKWVSTVVRKIQQLIERRIVDGPWYTINHGKLCKNPLHSLLYTLESNQCLETVFSYLKEIEPFIWVYPVLSPHKTVLLAGFLSSDDAATTSLVQLLKDNNIITDYVVRTCCHRDILMNPTMAGEINPSLDNLLGPCDTPDLSFGHHDTNWNKCDISVLPYLHIGCKYAKLLDILKAERNRGNLWTYGQIQYSYKKMIKNDLIRKEFIVYPFPVDHAVHFILYFTTKDITVTQRILHNFARNAWVLKSYTLYGEWGFIMCSSHTTFLTNLVYKLGCIDEITKKEVYHLRSLSGNRFFVLSLVLQYFDVDTQTLQYPYRVYREKIKEKIEGES